MTPAEYQWIVVDVERLKARVKAMQSEIADLEARIKLWEQDNLKTEPNNAIPLRLPDEDGEIVYGLSLVSLLDDDEVTAKISVAEGAMFPP